MAHRILSAIAQVFAKTDTDLYAPLDTSAHTIRLLQLQPGAWNNVIRAVLQESSIAEARDRYVTISYTWGHVDVVRQVSMWCNGRSIFISENLFTALRRLRRTDRSILVWADAICINQADILERTQQVALMGEIYSKGQETMIWLGEPTPNEDVGAHLFSTYDTSTTYLSKERPPQVVWKGDSSESDHRLRDLYLHAVEHSTTAGLVPENSGLIDVQAGPDIFGAFCLIQDLAEGAAHPILRALDQDKANALQRHGFRSTWHGLILARAHVRGSRSSRVWEGLERLMTRPWWERIWVVQETVVSQKATILYGMLSAPWSMFARAAKNYVQERHTLCLDLAGTLQGQEYLDIFSNLVLRIEDTRSRHYMFPRDATLLSLLWKFRPLQATDKRDKVFALLGLTTNWQEQPLVSPDYHQSIAETFIHTALDNIRRLGSLSVLAGDLEAVLNRKRLERLPSWVMDWSLPCLSTEIERVNSLQMYNASGGRKGTVRFLPKHGLLEIEAILVDQVCVVGEVSRHTQLSDTCAVIRACNLLTKTFEQRLQAYPTGGTYDNAFWRTLVGDLMYTSTGPNIHEESDAYRRAKAEDFDAFRAWRMWSRCISRDTFSRTASFTQRDLDEGISSIHHALKTATASRRFFLTSTGYMGIGPKTTTIGDNVQVFKGSNVPFMTRQDRSGPLEVGSGTILITGDSQDDHTAPTGKLIASPHRLVGDCFVYGQMDGEVFEQADARVERLCLI